MRGFLAFAGLSIRDFSRETGVPYRTLQDYLADKRLPGAAHLGRMARAGIDLNWLLTGKLRPTVLQAIRDGSDQEGFEAVGADLNLLDDLSRAAWRDADGYAARLLERSGTRPLPSEGLAAFAYYLRLKLRTAAAMTRHLEAIRRDGHSNELIIDILTPAAPADLDPAVDEFVASAKAQY